MKKFIAALCLFLSSCGDNLSLQGSDVDAEIRCGLEGQACCNEGNDYWCDSTSTDTFELQVICRNFEPGGPLNGLSKCERRNARQQDGGVR